MQPESCALLPNDSKDTQDTLMHNMEPKNARLLYSITVAAAGSLLKRHTPNFGWRQIYPSLQNILEKSHAQLFLGTLGSLLRLSLHIEKMPGRACGMNCVNAIYQIPHILALFTSVYPLSRPLFLSPQGKPMTNIPNQSRAQQGTHFGHYRPTLLSSPTAR